MKKKWMASTALACSCMLLISGCSGNKADDFDAVAYTTAYLDGMIRGMWIRFLPCQEFLLMILQPPSIP